MIERFKNIFEGLDRAHGVTLVGESNGDGNKITGKSFVKREPVTDDLWQKHLDGKDSLGVIPINDDNKCKWGCIDIDSYAGFDHKKLIDKIKNLNLPLLVFTEQKLKPFLFEGVGSYFYDHSLQKVILRRDAKY